MVVYLEDAWNEGRAAGKLKTIDELIACSVEAGSMRVRPLRMTVLSNVFGLLPIMFDTGVGADVAKRIAAPMWEGERAGRDRLRPVPRPEPEPTMHAIGYLGHETVGVSGLNFRPSFTIGARTASRSASAASSVVLICSNV